MKKFILEKYFILGAFFITVLFGAILVLLFHQNKHFSNKTNITTAKHIMILYRIPIGRE